jgi:hypothetical protein
MGNDDENLFEHFTEDEFRGDHAPRYPDDMTPKKLVDRDGRILSTGLGSVGAAQDSVGFFQPDPAAPPDMPVPEPIFLQHRDGSRSQLFQFRQCGSGDPLHFHFRTMP